MVCGTSTAFLKNVRKFPRNFTKSVMKSHRFRIPKYDMPIRLRLWFLVFTCIIMVVLAFLGFTDFSRSLPLNDKLLHFLCFCLATGVFYFIIDVEEDARRIWFWRHSGLIFTAIVCFFCGGILSEFVQSLLPYKFFDVGDMIANLLGSSVGLSVAYHLERYYRYRREINRLYRPLETSLSDLSDLEDETGTQLLPTYNTNSDRAPKSSQYKAPRFADVWDEREEVFDIGGASDEEDDRIPGPAIPPHNTEQGLIPKITVCGP